MTVRSTTEILGIPVDRVTMTETIERIGEFVDRGRADGSTFQVATVNVDFITNAVGDADLAALLRRVDLAIPDGMPIVWGARLLGEPIAERVTGADLVPMLATACAARGLSMYLFGSSDGTAEAAAALLRAANPGLEIVGDAGPVLRNPAEMPDDALKAIRDADPDVICVALGNPKQEWWIEHHRRALGVPVLIGVGGTLDLLVGDKRRAPAWIGRLGLEWVYRAVQEPKRLGPRYARDIFIFLPRLTVQVVRVRWHRWRGHGA